jgi:hypothetical protein
MADAAKKEQPGKAAHGAGQRGQGNDGEKHGRSEGSVGIWSPGDAHGAPARTEPSLDTMIDRLAEAAAAHDGEAARTVGE